MGQKTSKNLLTQSVKTAYQNNTTYIHHNTNPPTTPLNPQQLSPDRPILNLSQINNLIKSTSITFPRGFKQEITKIELINNHDANKYVNGGVVSKDGLDVSWNHHHDHVKK
jgi:hypothetical protein